MINTTYSTLYEAPKALYGVGVGIADNVFARSVIAPFMSETVGLDGIIDRILIRVDNSAFGNVLIDKRHDGRAFGISNNIRGDFALPLGDTNYGCLALCTTPTFTRPFTANISLVNFDFILEHTFALVKKFADLLEHAPCCLIGYTRSSLKFFSRMTATSSSHPKHGLKPYFERGAGLMKDRSSSWVNFMSAKVTFVARSFSYFVMLCYSLANRTLNAAREAVVFKPFQTSIVIREFFLKVFERVFNLFLFSHFLTLSHVVYHNNYVVSRDNRLDEL